MEDKIILPYGLKKAQKEVVGHRTVWDYIMAPNSVTGIRENAFHLGENGTCPVQLEQLCLLVLRPEPPAEFR